MLPLELDVVRPAGDLLRRTELNFRRLHDPEFHVDATLASSTAREAPGDWVGRALLALTLHADLAGRDAPHRAEFLPRLASALGTRGYLGETVPAGTADENQLGGHNALLCGLAEVWRRDRDPKALELGRGVVDALFLPALPLVALYPDRPPPSLRDGSQIGLTVAQPGPWRGLSTDVGILFFCIDGLTRWHAIDPDTRLAALIETLARRYAQLDPVAMGAQTHGTLSTLRGLLRWHRATGDHRWRDLVVRRHGAYLTVARTEHHANHNWFGRPAWTEACAVIDSFLLALELWTLTGEESYLEEAHWVWHNAMAYAQRPNGGYGCDACVGAAGRTALEPHEFYEAPWCCTMRGAEGLAGAARHLAVVAADGSAVAWPLHLPGEVKLRLGGGETRVLVESELPRRAATRWQVRSSTATGPVKWRVHTPPGVESVRLMRNGHDVAAAAGSGRALEAEAPLIAGDVWTWQGEMPLRAWRPLAAADWPEHERWACGPRLLGVEDGGATVEGAGWRHPGSGRALTPLDEVTFRPSELARRHRSELLLPVNTGRRRAGPE